MFQTTTTTTLDLSCRLTYTPVGEVNLPMRRPRSSNSCVAWGKWRTFNRNVDKMTAAQQDLQRIFKEISDRWAALKQTATSNEMVSQSRLDAMAYAHINGLRSQQRRFITDAKRIAKCRTNALNALATLNAMKDESVPDALARFQEANRQYDQTMTAMAVKETLIIKTTNGLRTATVASI